VKKRSLASYRTYRTSTASLLLSDNSNSLKALKVFISKCAGINYLPDPHSPKTVQDNIFTKGGKMKDLVRIFLAGIIVLLVSCGTQTNYSDRSLDTVNYDLEPALFDESCWPGPESGCPELVAGIPDVDFPQNISSFCVASYLVCLPSETAFEPHNMYYPTGNPEIRYHDDSIVAEIRYRQPGPEGDGRTKCESASVKKTSGSKGKAKCKINDFTYEREFSLSDNFSVSGKIYRSSDDNWGGGISFNWYFP
jgi:hypothetical protein